MAPKSDQILLKKKCKKLCTWCIVDVLVIVRDRRLELLECENLYLGNTCLENGSYLMNYHGCANCHQKEFVLISNKATEDEDGEELVTYDHVCKSCDHVIARHEYTFSVVDEYQEYTMLCMLCGKAEDSISVLPDDPRQSAPLF